MQYKSTKVIQNVLPVFKVFRCIKILKIAHLQAHKFVRGRVLSNVRNVYRVEVVNVCCFVIIIQIYKVISKAFSNTFSGVKVQYLNPRCSGVKVLEIGNTQVKYKYLKIVPKYST